MSSETENNITKDHILITTDNGQAEGTPYTVYLDKEISEPHEYRGLMEFLDKAGEDDVFTLKMNGPGGRLDTCIQLVHAINSTKATVVGELLGEVCSAHSSIFIACHQHVTHPYSAMMVHTLSGGAFGKGEDIVRMGTAYNDIAKLMYTDIFEEFLTEEELKDVLYHNKDLWFIGGEEITSRLERVYEMRALEHSILEEEALTEAQDELIDAAKQLIEARKARKESSIVNV